MSFGARCFKHTTPLRRTCSRVLRATCCEDGGHFVEHEGYPLPVPWVECARKLGESANENVGGPTSPSMWHYPLHFITQSNVQSHSVTGSCACRFSLVHSFARQRTCDGTQSSDADQRPTLAVFLGGAHRLTFTCLDQMTRHHQCKPVRPNCVTCVTYDSLFEWDAHRKRPLRRGKVAAIGSDGLSVGA